MILICPSCNSHLVKITLTLTGSLGFEVDQCPNCRGVWFDHAEINALSFREAMAIADDLPTGPIRTILGLNLCPRCKVPLEILRAESVPQDSRILTCPECGGNWFSREELCRFKYAQKTKIDYFKAWKIPLQSIYAILLPLLIIVSLTVGIFATTLGVRQTRENRARAKELISQPKVLAVGPAKVEIFFTTSQAAAAEIEYQTTGFPKKTLAVSITPQTVHSASLENLAQGRDYSFWIKVSDREKITTTSSEYFFTAP